MVFCVSILGFAGRGTRCFYTQRRKGRTKAQHRPLCGFHLCDLFCQNQQHGRRRVNFAGFDSSRITVMINGGIRKNESAF